MRLATNRTTGARVRRAAITLLEVLVATSLIGMLMALLLPGVQLAREAARRTACASNLRNVALALSGEMNAKRRLPAFGNFDANGAPFHGWVVSVLPYLERAELSTKWRFDRRADAPPNSLLSAVGIGVLICPDDDTAMRGEGNLSYVVNGGFGWTQPIDCPSVTYGKSSTFTRFDFNGNGVTCPTSAGQDVSPFGVDKNLFYKTSLFFGENSPYGSGTVRHHTGDSIADGLSNTIMLSENLWAGFGPDGGNWASPLPWRTCFFLSGYVCQKNRCSSGNVDWQRANRHSGLEAAQAVNGSLSAVEGESPWPSSRHPGGVSMAFCDGHLRFLDEDIDGAVYACLVTPQGTTIHGPLAQSVVQGDGE